MGGFLFYGKATLRNTSKHLIFDTRNTNVCYRKERSFF
ncbi:MAG: hypothetical protein JWQ38_2778 [Flavipsychrobacter sp.]|nr:hypothetical protein [Flavipsychrobacter sp.]